MNVEQIEKVIDKWLTEIRDTSNTIRNNPNATLQQLSGYADRWDAIRTEAFLSKMKAARICHDAKAILDDNMRSTMDKGFRRQSDFQTADEKRAKYETLNLTYVIEYRKYARILEQLEDLLRFIATKLKWISDKVFNAHHEEKKEMHYSTRENYAVD